MSNLRRRAPAAPITGAALINARRGECSRLRRGPYPLPRASCCRTALGTIRSVLWSRRFLRDVERLLRFLQVGLHLQQIYLCLKLLDLGAERCDLRAHACALLCGNQRLLRSQERHFSVDLLFLRNQGPIGRGTLNRDLCVEERLSILEFGCPRVNAP